MGTLTPPYQTLVQADGPLASYHLDETSGTGAFDSSGNGYQAVLSGVQQYGASGALLSETSLALCFQETTAGLSFPSSLTQQLLALPAYTLEFWVATALTLPSSLTWDHVILVGTTSGVTCYVNGASISSSPTGTIAVMDVLSQVEVVAPFVYLDEVACYPYALTATQVALHYRTGMNVSLVVGRALAPRPTERHPYRFSGGVTQGTEPVDIPSLVYAVGGVLLPDQPHVATAPQSLFGQVLPTGGRFTLLFANPSLTTQGLLVSGSQVMLTFGLANGQVVSAPVMLESATVGLTFVVTATLL